MTELAVIGIDAKFCGHHTIDHVERAFYQGVATFDQPLNSDLATLCLDSVSQLAANNQLACSALAVVVVLEVHAKRDQLSQQLAKKCASCDIYPSLALALAQVTALTANGQTAVALLGVNQVNSEQPASEHLATISFDQTFTGYQHRAGIASLLLTSANFAQDHNAYIYGLIKGFATGTDVSDVASAALSNAKVTADQVGLLEVSALATLADTNAKTNTNANESRGLINAYQGNKPLHTAISCARGVLGEGAGFSQVAGLLKTVLSLHQRYISPLTNWQQPQASDLTRWQHSAFYFPVDARPWYPNSDGSAHIAAYSCQTDLAKTSSSDSYCHIIVQENLLALTDNERAAGQRHAASDVRANGYFAAGDLTLVLVSGDNEQQLQQELHLLLSQQAASDVSLKTLAQQCFSRFNSDAKYAISLIAQSLVELSKEITQAQAGITKAIKDNSEWKTPKGSYFSATPAGTANDTASNGVAFMYPGIGATYVGLGRDLFHLFPQIYQPVADLADDISCTLKDTLLNPRSIVRHNFKELKQLDLELRGNLANIAEAGVGFACVFTKVFEEVFEVKADFATGYSMGEVSMYAALGCWQQPGLMSARLASSNTFNHQLCCELRTLRNHWDLPDVPNGTFEQIWETYTIKATIEQVNIATVDEPRVYCTIINTPDNLLLAGYPDDCLRVVKKLGVRAMALNMANAIHSAPAYDEYDHMVSLYTMDVTPRIKTKMYSSSCYLPIPQMSKAIAHSIAKCLCDVVDFPRLVNTIGAKGARVFIEMGPGRSLCAWVDKIINHQHSLELSNSPERIKSSHVSVPVNAKGTADELTYIRAIAKLISHGVRLNLDSLFYGSILEQSSAGNSQTQIKKASVIS